MKLLVSLLIFTVFTSCASFNKKKQLKNEINNGEVSTGAVIDLARSSYLKGCVEGIKHLTKKQSKGVYFDFCKVKAKLHEEEILSIIK